jgi:tripeptidyl-peptidase-1
VPDLLTPTDTNEPYLDWLNYVLALNSTPQVISTSYGDDEQTVPQSYATAVCNGFAQLGARGVTLLFSSGDNGVGPKADCFTNDGKNTSSFLPAFPAGCVRYCAQCT